MQLRVKSVSSAAAEQITLKFDGTPETVTYAEFEMKLKDGFKRNDEVIAWKVGFPPRSLALPVDKDTFLSDFGIRNSDTISIEFYKGEVVTEKKSDIISSIGNAPTGEMVLRKMDDDNSCLFHAISYVFNGPFKEDAGTVANLRQLIVDKIRGNPQEYTAVVLGRSPEDYCNWIRKKSSWGGAIELAIFARHFQSQIVSIDVKTLRCDIFGESEGFEQRGYLMYDGIHYDALAFNIDPLRNGNPEYDITILPVSDDDAYMKAIGVAEKLQLNFQYTDTAAFSIKCDVCGEILKVKLMNEMMLDDDDQL